MKFPISHCIPTHYFRKHQYDLLITKLVSEGYHYPSQTDKCGYFDLWDFLGVNRHGDILLLDNPEDYIPIHVEKWNNILTKEWLKEYLNGK